MTLVNDFNYNDKIFFFDWVHQVSSFFFYFIPIFTNLIMIVIVKWRIIKHFYIYCFLIIISDWIFYQIHEYYENFHFKQDFGIIIIEIIKCHFLIPF